MGNGLMLCLSLSIKKVPWPELGQRITSGLFFEGLGRGHGAGLCQEGAHEYAARSWSSQRILAHYLPGARLADLPPTQALSRDPR